VFVLKNYSGSHSVNIGFGEDLTIAANGGRRLSRRDCLRSLKTRRHAAKTGRRFAPASHGWNAKVSLREGLGKAYAAFLTDAVLGGAPQKRLSRHMPRCRRRGALGGVSPPAPETHDSCEPWPNCHSKSWGLMLV
jgi:hypothetical protein